MLKNNIKFYAAVKQIQFFANNQMFQNQIRTIGGIDSIQDFERFRKTLSHLKQKGPLAIFQTYGADAYYYGYYHQMVRYAGQKLTSIPLFPGIEHGIKFDGTVWKYVDNYLSYAAQGAYRSSHIHQIDSWKPVFVVGPYIHYAQTYYSHEVEKIYKRKLGKTLLVFPSHTNEWDNLSGTDNDFVDIIYEKYSKYFDSILVCAYWNDVDSPVFEDFSDRGAIIVSAGYRGDPQFICRLKTIISLSDAVVGDDIATNIGFCLYMKKPFFLEKAVPRYNTPLFLDYFDKFKCAFSSDKLEFETKQIRLQLQLYSRFWGGNESILNSKEMDSVLNLMKKILHDSKYNAQEFSDTTRDLLKTLQNSAISSDKDQLQYVLLKKALNIDNMYKV